jgi:hypothetical protein
LDQGWQWTFSVDPVDSQVIYTNSGYGATSRGSQPSFSTIKLSSLPRPIPAYGAAATRGRPGSSSTQTRSATGLASSIIPREGAYYLGCADGIRRSPDGIIWTLVSPSPSGYFDGIVGNGTTIFASALGVCQDWGTGLMPYLSSPENDGLTWTPMASPGMTQGGVEGYDLAHHILSSSNCQQGFWRVVTP